MARLSLCCRWSTRPTHRRCLHQRRGGVVVVVVGASPPGSPPSSLTAAAQAAPTTRRRAVARWPRASTVHRARVPVAPATRCALPVPRAPTPSIWAQPIPSQLMGRRVHSLDPLSPRYIEPEQRASRPLRELACSHAHSLLCGSVGGNSGMALAEADRGALTSPTVRVSHPPAPRPSVLCRLALPCALLVVATAVCARAAGVEGLRRAAGC